MIVSSLASKVSAPTDTIEEIFARRIGANIAALRNYRGLTQVKLVEAMNQRSGGEYLYRQALSRSELGERLPPIYELEAFCKFFKVPLKALLYAENMAELVEAIYANQHQPSDEWRS
jgi:transcriptional regulator with XRE-family HTH domain